MLRPRRLRLCAVRWDYLLIIYHLHQQFKKISLLKNNSKYHFILFPPYSFTIYVVDTLSQQLYDPVLFSQSSAVPICRMLNLVISM